MTTRFTADLRPGEPIPGSKYLRDYCAVCGDPIRIAVGCKVGLQECQDCRGALPRKIINQQHTLRNKPR